MGVTFGKDLKDQAVNGETMVIVSLQTTSKDGQKALKGSKGILIEEVMLPHNAAALAKAMSDIQEKDAGERRVLEERRKGAPEKKAEPAEAPKPAGAK